MDSSTLVLGLIALALVAYIGVFRREKLSALVEQARYQATMVLFSFPGGILIAAFLSQIVPARLLAGIVGQESGVFGVVVAGFLGGLIPGGPMVSFPIALTIWHAGAGPAQMIAFLTGWSLFAFHRILTYELPLIGPRFVATRLVASLPLPLISGLIALLLLLWGWSVS